MALTNSQQQLLSTQQLQMCYKFECALRQYIAAFDGTNRISAAESKSRFDNLHHKDFTFIPKDKRVRNEDTFMFHLTATAPLSRDEAFLSGSRLLATGTKVTLIHFRKIGMNCVDVKLRLVNSKVETTNRIVATISCRQAIVSRDRDIDECFPLKVLEAKCASAMCKWREVGSIRRTAKTYS